MLRKSWHVDGKSDQILRDELGKRYWVTRRAFMKKAMLLAFVEEMGHEYEELLEGAADEKEGEAPTFDD